ncbi:MAG: UDP-N-acetylmuramoyl-tripeptide--D-alanyl-D-alanine ligase [Candidatus Bipolaricaulis sp.]|nr:UDP-N-acetylmuramoyl-tripeptide--D-alanyl-D-alanine ligase [Candidatus Bipolaricaulis sp.]
MFSIRDLAAVMDGVLAREGAGTPLRCAVDSRRVVPGDVFFALPGARTDGHAFLDDAFRRGAVGAVVLPGKPLPSSATNVIAVRDVLAALHAAARAWRERFRIPLVAITGSNGKTTTRNLLAHLLGGAPTVYSPHENYNTEIGLPAALASMPPGTEVGVFEFGAEKPGDIAFLAELLRPTAAVVTSVGESHLGGLGTLDGVAREKWSLIEALPTGAPAFVNADSPRLRALAAAAPRVRLVTVGLHHGAVRGRLAHAVPRLDVEVVDPPLRLSTQLIGAHNATNLLLAAACAGQMGVSPRRIEERAATFLPVAHRMQPHTTRFGVLLDDTYNANPASMAAALEVLAAYRGAGTRRVFVYGDMLGLGCVEETRHREVAELVARLGIDEVYPVGERATAACRAIVGSVAVEFVERERLARFLAARLTPERDAVVLVKGSHDVGLDQVVRDLLASSST